MKLSILATYIVTPILGLLSIILPVLFLEDLNQYEAPLFPLLRTGIEGISIYSFILLFGSGVLVKSFSIVNSWKIGLMSMALFPIAAICEMIVEPSSHNMFPFEFIFYGLITIPAIIGAYLAEGFKKLIAKRNKSSSLGL